MKIYLSQIKNHIDQSVILQGWLQSRRGSGKILFLQFRDGLGYIQAIAEEKNFSAEDFEVLKSLPQETSMRLEGTVSKHPKKDEYELQVSGFSIIQQPDTEYPISNKDHGVEFLFEKRHLWLRSKRQWAIQRIRNTIIYATYEFMNDNEFIKIDAPILTPNSCENTTDLYKVDHFGTDLYLSQSGQLYSEAAIFAHRKVFDFGPTFRAEKSKTRRHLNEFWMMDAEAAFMSHEKSMKVQESLICHIVKKVLEKNNQELIILERDIEALKKVQAPFIKMTHAEAIAELQEMGSDIGPDSDLGATDETILTKKYDKPIFIEKYPAKIKAFYMKRDPENESLALCSDLLAPEGYGEIIGGSAREDDYDTLLKRIQDEKLSAEDFEWYLDLRRFGSVPHAGFGFGLERLVTWISGIHHVREAIPFPRTLGRVHP
ncbi:asparagine--tRNA ligase [Candidatus Peregrinibacteria bacterium]|nr:MAG: asparagine--tRNA ligase [Candidatus Peregrinibacteria bacterium]